MRVNSQLLDEEQLEQRFDAGEEVLGHFDLDHPIVERHPIVQKRITLTMPDWIVEGLDEEAEELAISRNAVVNTWLAERIRAAHGHSQSAMRA
ncbi:type II toxin-antitoxin system BrnA family antitoxin [Bifidobacterium thermophilum]|uniref:type II toxin-antitoxin system BrnA family antitoxin n=1 Tax=Bifidobacterium thermophilum TaxID=33905 RepID=UPI0039931A4C